MAEEVDVLICGAGPVGLALAVNLEALGLSFTLVDRLEQRSELSKAVVLWGRSLELLDLAMDAGQIVRAGRPVRKATFFDNQVELASIDLSKADSPFGAGVMLPQNETERILEQHLASKGIRVERGAELLSFIQTDDQVHGQVRDHEGQLTSLHARFLVGCDGAHSFVRRGLDLPFPGELDLHRWFLADTKAKGPLPDSDIAAYWHRTGALVLIRLSNDVWRIFTEQPLSAPDEPRAAPTLQQMQEWLDQRGPDGVELFEPQWLAEFRIHERKVDQYRVGRVFLAGDAAHVHSPAGGQGMNTGIQDACNLAWKLAWERRGLTGPILLESYDRERGRIGDLVVRTTARVTDIVTTRSFVIQRLRRLIVKVGLRFGWIQKLARDNVAELSVGYPKSPISGDDRRKRSWGIRLGDRVPDLAWVTPDGNRQSLYGCLAGGHAVILLTNVSSECASSWTRSVDPAWPQKGLRFIQLTSIRSGAGQPPAASFAPAVDLKKIGLGESDAVIIRPDGYLAAAGPANDPKLLSRWLLSMQS